MDFTAYYTAGEISSQQKNIYKNYIQENFKLWDGVAVFNHSRFLYPPVIAKLFSSLSNINYQSAKFFWNLFNLLFAIIILLLTIRTFNFKKDINSYLIYFIILLNFFPFYALLERGQIDIFSLLFVLLAIHSLVKKNSELTSGIFFALSVFIKLNMIYILPFLILFRKWKTTFSFVLSLLILIVISIAFSGIETNKNYLINELPRISEFAESGTDDMKIDHYMLKIYFQMAPEALSFKDGKLYLTEFISFNSKASLTYYGEAALKYVGINLNRQLISLIFFTILFLPIVYLIKHPDINSAALWFLVLIIILLSSPFTWAMNLVWLFPIGFYIVNRVYKNGFDSLTLVFTAGFILIALPDNLWITDRSIFKYFYKFKYMIGEVILILSFFYLLKKTDK